MQLWGGWAGQAAQGWQPEVHAPTSAGLVGCNDALISSIAAPPRRQFPPTAHPPCRAMPGCARAQAAGGQSSCSDRGQGQQARGRRARASGRPPCLLQFPGPFNRPTKILLCSGSTPTCRSTALLCSTLHCLNTNVQDGIPTRVTIPMPMATHHPWSNQCRRPHRWWAERCFPPGGDHKQG